MVHHTAPHIPFKTSEEWNAAQAQLNGTVHCSYPRWYTFHLFFAPPPSPPLPSRLHIKNNFYLLDIGVILTPDMLNNF